MGHHYAIWMKTSSWDFWFGFAAGDIFRPWEFLAGMSGMRRSPETSMSRAAILKSDGAE